MDGKKKSPSVFEINLFYLVIAILFIFIGAYVQKKDIYSGLVITEYVLILLPTILYLKVRGYSLKRVLKLNKLSLKQVLLIPLIVLLSYPIGAFLNAIMALILSTFGELIPPPLPTPTSGGSFFIGLLIIALSPGICEEVMFRGMLMKAYDRKGIKNSIIFSAILFGVFHFNIQNLLGPIFLGLLFGYIVYKTNSIYSSILAHTTNNAIAWTLTYFIGKSGIDPSKAKEVSMQMPYTVQMALGALMLGGIAIVTGTGAYFLLKALPKDKNSLLNENVKLEKKETSEKSLLIQYSPIIGIAVIYVVITFRIIKMIQM
ncbi:MAG: CPBP family intramembrane metalloprotease [Firmicutes bacterium]|nr:CPBP family intramembrane metalloprotease [Bacillota bacterium]